MPDPGTFPDSLRSAAVPRWSHRDPVECGNPFMPDDDRHPLWHAATSHAKDTLVRIDVDLELTLARHPKPYPVRLVSLAVVRFNVWSERALAIVENPNALEYYERWLDDYRENWLEYVADTCPRVDVANALRARLTERSQFWIDRASREL